MPLAFLQSGGEILTFSALQQLGHPHSFPLFVQRTQDKLGSIVHFQREDIISCPVAVDWVDLLDLAEVDGSLHLIPAVIRVVCKVTRAIMAREDEPPLLPVLQGNDEGRKSWRKEKKRKGMKNIVLLSNYR